MDTSSHFELVIPVNTPSKSWIPTFMITAFLEVL